MKVYLSFFMLIFLSLNGGAAVNITSANIDLSKFSGKALESAFTLCGIKILSTLKSMPICTGDRCVGGYYSNHNMSTSVIDENVTEHTWSFRFQNDYRSHHPYDGTSYSFKLIASTGIKDIAPLMIAIEEYYSHKSDKISVVSDGNMPAFRVTKKLIPNCRYDEWGRRICGSSTIEYSDPVWVVGKDFRDVVPWKNSETGVILKQEVNFGYFMRCVESKL